MAVKTKEELRDYADANINTNGVQGITGASQNTMLNDIIDSVTLDSELSDDYVPYIGATDNLDLGSYDLTATDVTAEDGFFGGIETDLLDVKTFISNITTVNTATYSLLVTDLILNVTYTATGAPITITLPTAQVVTGRSIVVKDAGGNASTNNITIDTEGAETIDGAATAVIAADYNSINLYSDGSNWFIY